MGEYEGAGRTDLVSRTSSLRAICGRLPELICTEYRTGDAVSQSCTPVPDRWYFAATLEGTPAELTVAVERDGVALLDEHRTLAYRDEYPNGPECDPVCRQASAALTLSPDW